MDNQQPYTHVTHEFPPLFDAECEVLILGSMPSPKSREQGFYYGHPQNRFWKVIAAVLGEEVPRTIEEKKHMMLAHHIALWDVLEACDIRGASDSSVKNPVPTDLCALLRQTRVTRVYTTGATAYRYYQKFQFPLTRLEAIQLPSTSPANCAVSLPQLIACYRVIC